MTLRLDESDLYEAIMEYLFVPQYSINPWPDYEMAKANWIASHPGSSCEEYEQAMRFIAREIEQFGLRRTS